MRLRYRWFTRWQMAALLTVVSAVAGCSSEEFSAGVCEEGEHRCDGVCVGDASIEHCGAACTPCPADGNGEAVCEAGACGLKCRDGALLCSGACAPCPGSTGVQKFRCEGSSCVASCAQDFEACAAGCCPVDIGLVLTNSGAAAPSIAVDSKQSPHVSFLADHYTLTYAHRDSGGWKISNVGADGNAYSTSITVAAGDRPIVAYSGNYSVRVARFDGTAWQHEIPYRSSRGYGPAISGQALALDSAGRPHIVASQVYNESGTYNSYLLHIFWDGAAWNYEHVQDVLNNRYSVPSLAIDGKDVLHVSWVSYYDGAVNYATNADGRWRSAVAVKDGSCCDTSYIALNAAGTPSVAFELKGGGYAVGERPMAMGTWSFASRHPNVSGVGNLAFNPMGMFHYVVRNDAGQLFHGSPRAPGWKESVISTEAKQFMMTLDASERAHVIMATDQALKYVRVNKE